MPRAAARRTNPRSRGGPQGLRDLPSGGQSRWQLHDGHEEVVDEADHLDETSEVDWLVRRRWRQVRRNKDGRSSSASDPASTTTGIARRSASALISVSSSRPFLCGRLRSSGTRSGRGALTCRFRRYRKSSASTPSDTTRSSLCTLLNSNASLTRRTSPGIVLHEQDDDHAQRRLHGVEILLGAGVAPSPGARAACCWSQGAALFPHSIRARRSVGLPIASARAASAAAWRRRRPLLLEDLPAWLEIDRLAGRPRGSSPARSGTRTTRKPSGSWNVTPCSDQYGLAGATGSTPRREATVCTVSSSPR